MVQSQLFRIGAVSLLSILVTTGAIAQTDLESAFQHPPKSAKPHTWWHWINGNITKAGITKDLEAMKHFGLAGAQIFNVDVGIPAGDKPFMSPQWKDAIAWAFKEAKRLDMELDIHNGAGWSSSGGPWVKPEHGMQNLTWSETTVSGPTHFDANLPEPSKKYGYYKDVACYAIRKPANDQYRTPNIQAKAAFERGDRISPDGSGVPSDAATSVSDVIQLKVGANGHVSADIPAGDWTIIRMGHTPNGSQNEPSPKSGLGLEVDKLSREALDEFWSGMMATAVKANGKATKSGLVGALIDSYEVGSQNWTPKFREEFMKRRGYDPMPYLPTVTGRVIGSGEMTERFLWDLRRTVCDLFADNYFGYMTELCHRHGIKFSTEGYGNGSFDNLQINGLPDIPMAEFWIGGGATETTKMVSSSAHTYGKRVVGAESFTADDSHAKWLYDPYSMKVLGDKMFSYGINRYIFHRYALQPWLDVEPGMTMGPWGTNFDRTITWWEPGRAWIDYVTRCQSMLQSGRFVADVLVFEGDDGPNDLPLSLRTTIPYGYDYDGCDAKVLAGATVEHGEVVLKSGMRYRVLMLPESGYATVATMRKIAELVREGASVVGKAPTKSPSLAEMGKGDEEIMKLSAELWGGNSGKGRVFANDKIGDVLVTLKVAKDLDTSKPVNWIHRKIGTQDVYFVANPNYRPMDLSATFRVSGEVPEIWNPETGKIETARVWSASGGVTTVPLRLESADSVFVVFRHKAPKQHITQALWVGEDEKEIQPPKVEIVSAKYEAVDGSGSVDATEKVRELLSHGETSIGATNSNFGDPFVNKLKELRVIYTLDGQQKEEVIPENGSLDFVKPGPDNALPLFSWKNGQLHFWKSGKVALTHSDGSKQVVDGSPSETILSQPWTLTFPKGKGAPPSIEMPNLTSWTESENPGVKYFSGTATYHTKFDFSGLTGKNETYWLDLGRVKNLAEITINGHALATLWKAPFRVDVSKYLRNGSNSLEIKVTNLWPNRLIGDEQYPAEAKYKGPIQEWPDWVKKGLPRPKSDRITFATWQFFSKDSPLLESGIIGPVKILTVPIVLLK